MRAILTVIGTRPQFIKAAAVSQALRTRSNLREIIVHTGQHFDDNMSRQFFEELDIPTPTYSLDIHGGAHGEMTGRMLQEIELVIGKVRPDLVLVYGDTNSTVAAALAAAKMRVPVAHVEAGLRSFDRSMPEEINRIVTDHISGLLFCPTKAAVANLRREGIVAGVTHVGDVMYDMTQRAAALVKQKSRILERLALRPNSYAVATVHRAESTDEPDKLARIFMWLAERAVGTTGHNAASPTHTHCNGACCRQHRRAANDRSSGLFGHDGVGAECCGGLHGFRGPAEGSLLPPRSLHNVAYHDRMG